MKVLIEFRKLQDLCKYCHPAYDQGKIIEPVCDHPSNHPHGCSWGGCNAIDCPFCILEEEEWV